jgi:hypothetical protein
MNTACQALGLSSKQPTTLACHSSDTDHNRKETSDTDHSKIGNERDIHEADQKVPDTILG